MLHSLAVSKQLRPLLDITNWRSQRSQELGLFSCSQGTGLGRQLLVRRTPQEDTDALEVPVEAPEPPVVQRSEGPRSRKRRGVHLVEKSMPF